MLKLNNILSSSRCLTLRTLLVKFINLIQSVLDYHHIPEHTKSIVKSLYTDFKTLIIMSGFRTPFISVGCGVLQSDCLSPLLFDMCFNTFIQHIKADKYRQFGVTCNFLNPIHWFQFADDVAVIMGQECENQHLLNRFTIWCQWSNMIELISVAPLPSRKL